MPCSGRKQPRKLGADEERKLRRLKEDVMSAYTQESESNKDRDSEPQEYFNKVKWTTVKEIRKNGDLVVKPSDKGKCFVVMAKES